MSDNKVEKLAALARITIPTERREALEAEFDGILAYIGQLDELTLASAGQPIVPPLHNVFREDTDPYAKATWTERLVSLFPSKVGNALSVKKIISHD